METMTESLLDEPSTPSTARTVAAFFDAFDAAFGTFDGSHVADRYATPYLACRADGSAELLDDRPAIGRYFQRFLDDYHRRGVRSCRHTDLAVEPVGAHHVLATVTWQLCDERLDPVVVWREAYLLTDESGRWLIRGSIDHE